MWTYVVSVRFRFCINLNSPSKEDFIIEILDKLKFLTAIKVKI